MTNPKSKRKATAFIEEPAEEESEVAGSDYESDQVSGHVKKIEFPIFILPFS
jgi:hypothetical protein